MGASYGFTGKDEPFGLSGSIGSQLGIKDQGVPEGDVSSIDFDGAGVSVAVAGGEAVVSIPGASPSQFRWRKLRVTTPFAIGEQMDITTGLGTVSGVAVIEAGSSLITLPGSDVLWYTSNNFEAYEDGVLASRQNEIMWSPFNSLLFYRQLDVGDEILIKEYYS